MWDAATKYLKAPVFPGDEEKTRRARALHSLQVNIIGAVLVLGGLGVLFFFDEKLITSLILAGALLIAIVSGVLNRRGFVKAAGIIMIVFLWSLTVLMMGISSGMQSLDAMFFISGTVMAGIVLGAGGAYFYAVFSLLTGLAFILAGNAGVEFLRLFTFPPLSAWILLFINLVITVVPLQVALQSLTDSASRVLASEERYRTIASVMSDYAFSTRYRLDGGIEEQWIGGAFHAITGFTPDEYHARGGWLSILHPDDREQDELDMASLHANQDVITQVRIIRKGGETRWVRVYGHPQWDENNNRLAGIYGAVQDITAQKRTENDLRQREAILEIVANTANSFLKISDWNTETWEREINTLLERLGTTIQASHVYIFENHLAQDGSPRMTMRYEWTAPGFESDLGNPKYINKPMYEEYLESWNEYIKRGEPYIGDVDHLSREDLESLNEIGLKALLDVPIVIGGVWWGVIGFDDMAGPHQWSNAEVGALMTAANLLAATIRRLQLDGALKSELDHRRKLIAELEVRNAESETLRESAAIVAASLEKRQTLSLILEQIARVVRYQSASVQLIRGDRLEVVSSRGVDLINQDVGMSFPINEQEPAYGVIEGRLPYILYDDVQVSVPSFNDIPHNNIRAWMAVPLKAKGRILGIIAMDGDRAGQFSEKDAILAVTYANQAAIAIENSRLFTELQAELTLKQNLIAELENKNAELERFTYTVSHDLRSPLVTIRGFLGYMKKDVAEGRIESFHRDLERVGNATLRMDTLLKDLLELSRIGRLVNQLQDVPFDLLVKDALEIVHGRIEKRGITLQVHRNLPAVYVDRPRLVEVLQNLIDNAAKYMGNQPHPVIEIGMDGRDEAGNPVFFVRDNGMGVAPEYHDRIFRLFDKLDPSSEGTGVGLALVKRIVEVHGGRIWVHSEAGLGSTFNFTLAGRE